MKRIGLYIISLILFLAPVGLLAQQTEGLVAVLQKRMADTLKEYETILNRNQWRTDLGDNKIYACKFTEDFNELIISIDIEKRNAVYVVKVSTVKNGESSYQDLYVNSETLSDEAGIKNLLMPLLMSYSVNPEDKADKRKIIFTSLSAGYNRTHDNKRFYPEYGEGSFYMSAGLLYDPSINIKNRSITLYPGDYLDFNFYYAYDSQLRENFFNVDILLWGNNSIKKDSAGESRTLCGFFNGFEYFRPGFYDPTLEWSRMLYRKQPHIQYTLWRAIELTLLKSYESGSKYSFYLMASFGPSINSSITATDVDPSEEEDLSHIFKSIKYRKQNYYYSVVTPLAFKFIADKIGNFRFSMGHNFYFFYPIENEKAYDMLNISKFSAGYYITGNLIFDANYEFWQIKGKVRDASRQHYWNRMILELRYAFN